MMQKLTRQNFSYTSKYESLKTYKEVSTEDIKESKEGLSDYVSN